MLLLVKSLVLLDFFSFESLTDGRWRVFFLTAYPSRESPDWTREMIRKARSVKISFLFSTADLVLCSALTQEGPALEGLRSVDLPPSEIMPDPPLVLVAAARADASPPRPPNRSSPRREPRQ